MTTVAERHHEQPRLAICAGARISREPAFVNLRFLTGRRLEVTTDFRSIAAQLASEPFDGIVRTLEAVVFDEVLIDRCAVAAFGELALDERTERRRVAACR